MLLLLYMSFAGGAMWYAFGKTRQTAVDLAEIKEVLCNGTINFVIGTNTDMGYVLAMETVPSPGGTSLEVEATRELIERNYDVVRPSFTWSGEPSLVEVAESGRRPSAAAS